MPYEGLVRLENCYDGVMKKSRRHERVRNVGQPGRPLEILGPTRYVPCWSWIPRPRERNVGARSPISQPHFSFQRPFVRMSVH